MDLILHVFRFDPAADQAGRLVRYAVPAEPQERLLDVLNRLRWEQDCSLSFRASCGHGVCGSDALRINGRCGLACQKLVRDLGGEVTLEPLPTFRVLKDLVVDLKPFFDRVALVRPYLQALGQTPEKERLQGPAEAARLSEAIRCILCASCQASCPQVAAEPEFLGPAPLVMAFRQVFDSRDAATLARLQDLDSPAGAWGCRNKFECTRVCPKEIKVTKAINQIKREIEQRLR
jgi:succinate dehydrogenase / fumarate reductase iron-sulfur subunit